MKNIRNIFLFTILLFCAQGVLAKCVKISLGQWTIAYDEQDYFFTISKGGKVVLDNVQPQARYDDAHFVDQPLSTADFKNVTLVRENENKAVFRWTNSNLILCESFTLVDDYLLVDLTLSSESILKSNYLSPIHIDTPISFFSTNTTNRILKVPYDNDDFVRYHQYPFGEEVVSFEACAFYTGESRKGLVIGSVDHDHWKSGIISRTAINGQLQSLSVFSGMSHKETRDVLPHGKLEGKQIVSARFFMNYVDDWRHGMEQFAGACLNVVPGRRNWQGGTPFGWQSWGVMSDKNSFQVDVAVSNYMHDVLQPRGFCNEHGKIVMSIDAWDNLADNQKDQLCEICEANDQIPGTYWTPFCLWWDANRILTNKLPGQNKYLAAECILKANGEFLKYDGAYCLDPTHPGVKEWIRSEIQKIKAHGFRYLKIDFTDNGMIQADSYYNPDVHTGVEAYNEGFTYFIQQADEGTPLYIALSIAPIFPYQYGNSRRIACDTWGRISHAEYSMNAISGGWWTNLLYQYNDPDHCPLIGNDDGLKTTLGENRARYTNLMCAGMALVCDNFDLLDKSGRGDAVRSRERSLQILLNSDVNEVGRLGRSFTPVYGYREFQNKHDGAESFFKLTTDDCTYVAVFNYSDEPMRGEIPLRDLGLRKINAVKELWFGDTNKNISKAIHYDVPAKDARLYKLM